VPTARLLDSHTCDDHLDCVAGSLALFGLLRDLIGLCLRDVGFVVPRDLLEEHSRFLVPNEGQVMPGKLMHLAKSKDFWAHEPVRFMVRSLAQVCLGRLLVVRWDEKETLWPFAMLVRRRLYHLQANDYDLWKSNLDAWQDGFFPLALLLSRTAPGLSKVFTRNIL